MLLFPYTWLWGCGGRAFKVGQEEGMVGMAASPQTPLAIGMELEALRKKARE